jgi:hypothetical protein
MIMKENRTQIAAAVAAVIALVVGLLLVVNNISSQNGSSNTDDASNPQGQAQVNPLQALPHTIAACHAYADARYAIATGDFTSAQELFSTVEASATLATSFDPKWQRLLTNVSEVANTSNFTALAQEVSDVFFPADMPRNIDTIESICGSVIESNLTADIARTMACTWLEQWNNTKNADSDNDLYRNVLGKAYDYATFTIQYSTDGTRDTSFSEPIWELMRANRSNDAQKVDELYESISASCTNG